MKVLKIKEYCPLTRINKIIINDIIPLIFADDQYSEGMIKVAVNTEMLRKQKFPKCWWTSLTRSYVILRLND